MIIATLIAATQVACCNVASCCDTNLPVRADQISCVIANEPISESVQKTDFAGVRYGFCCAGCVGGFAKDPAKAIAKAVEAKRTVGIALHDPVAGTRIEPVKAKGGYADFGGTRFYFASAENKAVFDAQPEKFGMMPKKEALYCPVMNHPVKSYSEAGAMADYDGVRYYLCCPNCLGEFKANPSKYIGNAAKAVSAPKPMAAPKAKP